MRAALPIIALVALATLGPSVSAQRTVGRQAGESAGHGTGANGGAANGSGTLGGGAAQTDLGLNGTIRTWSAPTVDQRLTDGGGASGDTTTTETPSVDDVAADRAADRTVDALIARLPLVGKLHRYD